MLPCSFAWGLEMHETDDEASKRLSRVARRLSKPPTPEEEEEAEEKVRTPRSEREDEPELEG
jgi:hypothetical protein